MIKRLVTKQEKEKNRKRNQTIVGIVLVAVMILSTIGFAIQSNLGNSGSGQNGNSTSIKYNGYQFENKNGLWILSNENGNFVFSYNPQQTGVDFINLSIKAEDYKGKPVYFYSNNEDAKNEIYVNMLNIAERVQEACVQDEPCNNSNLPVKDCSDNLIIIKENNSSLGSSITQNQNCVYIEANGNSQQTQAIDEFLFRILKIK